MTRLLTILAALAVCLAMPCAAGAQASVSSPPASTATVTGVVTDPSGALVPTATVTLHPVGSKRSAQDAVTHTDTFGRFTVRGEPGTQSQLVVTAPGFATFTSLPFRSIADRPRTPAHTMDVSLKIAEQALQIDVDDTNTMDTDPNNNGDAITLKGRAIDTLPLNPSELLLELQAMSGGDSPALFVDGFSNGQLPPRDTIREIRINQNPYSSQNDTNPGDGRIEIFTRPGTGAYHGILYIRADDSSLNTSNPFVPNQPPYYSYNYSGNLSGPINNRSSFSLAAGRQIFETNSLVDAQKLDTNNNVVPFTQAVGTPTTGSYLNARYDRAIGKKSTLIARYTLSQTEQTNGGIGGLSLATQGFYNHNTIQTLQLSNSQILSPKIVNDTRFQYSRSRVRQAPTDNDPTINVSGSFIGGGNNSGEYNDNQDRFELQNYVSQTFRKQFFTYGGRFRSTRDANYSRANYNGTFTFASLALAADCTPLSQCNSYQITEQNSSQPIAAVQLLGGGASQFSITRGNPNVVVEVADAALFFQDDWKARPNLTISGGLRFETQNRISDHADWAPRLGFAWALKTPKGKGPTYMLRGGAGFFYNRFTSGYVLQAARQNGISQQQYIVTQPNFFFTTSADANLTTSDLAGNQSQSTVYQISPTLHAPYFFSTTLSLERPIRKWGSVTLVYLSNRGVHSLLTRNMNAPLPGTYNHAVPTSGVRPMGGNQNVYEYESAGVYRSNRLSTNFYLQFKGRYSVNGYYMLRHDTSDANGAGFPSNQYDIGADEGRSSGDIRHSASVGATASLWGFDLATYTRASSGAPYNITVGQDLNGDGIYNDRPAFATDLTRSSVVRTGIGNFDTNPMAGQTIIPNNYGHSPGFFSVTLNLSRDFNFGPSMKPAANAAKLAPGAKPPHVDRKYYLTLGVDAQNVFNQLNLAPRIGTLNSPLFGRSIALNPGSGSTSANRVVDLAAYFHF